MTLKASDEFIFKIEALEFEPVARSADEQKASEVMWLRRGALAYGNHNFDKPAIARVTIPKAGTYYVWARYQTSPIRRRTFSIIIDGKELVYCLLPYGESPEQRPEIYQNVEADEKGMVWTSEEVSLPAGEVELVLTARPNPPFGKFKGGTHGPGVSRIIITSAADFRPAVD